MFELFVFLFETLNERHEVLGVEVEAEIGCVVIGGLLIS